MLKNCTRYIQKLYLTLSIACFLAHCWDASKCTYNNLIVYIVACHDLLFLALGISIEFGSPYEVWLLIELRNQRSSMGEATFHGTFENITKSS